MKVIDLLNKIANGEEVPRYEYNKNHEWFDDLDNVSRCKDVIFPSELNDEIEIMKDTSKEDKKIKRLSKCFFTEYDDMFTEWVATYNGVIVDKINEIIDRLNGEDDK